MSKPKADPCVARYMAHGHCRDVGGSNLPAESQEVREHCCAVRAPGRPKLHNHLRIQMNWKSAELQLSQDRCLMRRMHRHPRAECVHQSTRCLIHRFVPAVGQFSAQLCIGAHAHHAVRYAFRRSGGGIPVRERLPWAYCLRQLRSADPAKDSERPYGTTSFKDGSAVGAECESAAAGVAASAEARSLAIEAACCGSCKC